MLLSSVRIWSSLHAYAWLGTCRANVHQGHRPFSDLGLGAFWVSAEFHHRKSAPSNLSRLWAKQIWHHENNRCRRASRRWKARKEKVAKQEEEVGEEGKEESNEGARRGSLQKDPATDCCTENIEEMAPIPESQGWYPIYNGRYGYSWL